MNKIIVNGKVLLGKISGIERTSWEILKRWDKICDSYKELTVEILIPTGYKDKLNIFKNIQVVEYGKTNNLTLWQQFYLAKYVKQNKGIYVGLADSAPLLINKGFVLLHDISCLKNKEFYDRKSSFKFTIETKHVINNNFKIITVSHFSASEIAKEFNILEKDIFVIGNGWEHLIDVKEDNEIFIKHKLKEKSYYFSLSSLAPNKNFKWIMETAKLNPKETFVIAGGFKKDIYGNVDYDIPSNVNMLGRVSDEEAKSLLKNCKAFLFPTLYEGFGIPPLEAYACGTVSIVSDTKVMHEIYEDAVSYVDVSKPCDNICNISLPVYGEHKDLLKKHSWEKYAKNLLDYIYDNIEE